MARSYTRDGRGKFASAGRRGGVAKTIQQASREKRAEQRKAKAELSGGHLGTRRTRKVNRNLSAGQTATTKRQRNVAARAKARLS